MKFGNIEPIIVNGFPFIPVRVGGKIHSFVSISQQHISSHMNVSRFATEPPFPTCVRTGHRFFPFFLEMWEESEAEESSEVTNS